MVDYEKLGKDLRNMLNLKTQPVGIKLYENISDIPSEAEKIEKCTACQPIGIARYYEKATYTTKNEAICCAVGGAVLGFYDLDEDFANGERIGGLFAEDAESAAKLAEGPQFETGRYSAIACAPTSTMNFEPDVVLVYGDGDQMMSLIYAQVWDGGDKVTLESNGHGSSCRETIAAPIIENEIRLAVADIGEREHALAQDYELIMGIPPKELPRLVKNLKESTTQGIYKRPFRLNGLFTFPEHAIDRAGKRL